MRDLLCGEYVKGYQPFLIALALSAGAALACAPATTSVAASRSEILTPLSDPTLELSARALSHDFDLDLADARQQMLHQEATQALAGRLAATMGQAFGGAFINHPSSGELVVRTTSMDIADAAMAIESTTARSTTRFVLADRSWKDFLARAKAVGDQLRDQGIHIAAAVADPQDGLVHVVTPIAGLGQDDAYPQAVSSTASEPDVLVVRKGGLPRIASADTCTTATFYVCDPPLRGGVEIQANANLHPGNVSACTAGLNVRSTTGNPKVNYLLTAGHCLKTQPASCLSGGSGTNTWDTAFASDLTIHHIGAAGSSSYVYGGGACGSADHNHDAGKITVSNPTGWSLPSTSKVLVLESSGTDRSTTYAPQYPITALGSSTDLRAFQSYLCWTGATSGTSCGRFVGLDANAYMIESNQKVNGACGGDSGGPVYAYGKLYGLIESVGGSSSVTLTRYMYPSTVAEVTCTAMGEVFFAISAVVSFTDLGIELVP
jgi:hypothetical protein